MGFSKTGVAKSLGSVQVPVESETPTPKDAKDNSVEPTKVNPK
jgi:hypothetical protein